MQRFRCQSLLALLLLPWASAAAEPDVLPVIPAGKIPGDAALIVALDVQAVWDHPLVRTLRGLQPEAVAQLNAAMTEAIGLTAAKIEQIVFYWPDFRPQINPLRFAMLAVTRKPYDPAQIGKAAKPDVEPSPVQGLTPLDNTVLVEFTGTRLLTYIGRPYAAEYVGRQPTKTGLQSDTLALLGKHTLVIGAYLDRFPEEIRSDNLLPAFLPYQPLLKSQRVVVQGNLSTANRLKGRMALHSKDEANAVASLRALEFLRQLLVQVFETGPLSRPKPTGKTAANLVKQLLQGVTIARAGTVVTAELNTRLERKTTLAVFQEVADEMLGIKQSASVQNPQNNLKQIGLAIFNYESSNGFFPPATLVGKGGKPLLSWRVGILPWLEEEELYKQFKHDEPWDSAHNKKLLARMPSVYAVPGVSKEGATETHMQLFTGGGAMFDRLLPTRIPSVTDGLSNTIMATLAAKPVPWTKPDDIDYKPNAELPKLLFRDGRISVLFGDGAVRVLKQSIGETNWRRLIMKDDGQPIGDLDR